MCYTSGICIISEYIDAPATTIYEASRITVYADGTRYIETKLHDKGITFSITRIYSSGKFREIDSTRKASTKIYIATSVSLYRVNLVKITSSGSLCPEKLSCRIIFREKYISASLTRSNFTPGSTRVKVDRILKVSSNVEIPEHIKVETIRSIIFRSAKCYDTEKVPILVKS